MHRYNIRIYRDVSPDRMNNAEVATCKSNSFRCTNHLVCSQRLLQMANGVYLTTGEYRDVPLSQHTWHSWPKQAFCEPSILFQFPKAARCYGAAKSGCGEIEIRSGVRLSSIKT